MSMGHTQPRLSSGKKTLRKCSSSNIEPDNIVYIDVDGEAFDNVIVIDIPESLEKRLRGSSKNSKVPIENVIFVDDDEFGDDNIPTGTSVRDDRGFVNGGGLHSKQSGDGGNSSEAAGDNKESRHQKAVPVNISKCKRTYSGKVNSRNHYGLGSDSGSSESSDDGESDFMQEDSRGKLREQWEKASLKRKCDMLNGQSAGSRGVPRSASRMFSESGRNRVHTEFRQREEHPVSHNSGNSDFGKETSPFVASRDGHLGNTSGAFQNASLGDRLLRSVHRPHSQFRPANVQGTDQPHFSYCEKQDDRPLEQPGCNLFNDKEESPLRSSSFSCYKQDGIKVNSVGKDSLGKEKVHPSEPCTSKRQSCNGNNTSKGGLANEGSSFKRHQHSVRAGADHSENTFGGRGKKFQETACSFFPRPPKEPTEACSRSGEKEESVSDGSVFENIRSSCEKVDHCNAPSTEKVGLFSGKSFSRGNSSLQSTIGGDNRCHGEDGEPVSEKASFFNHHEEAEPKQDHSCAMEAEVGPHENGKKDDSLRNNDDEAIDGTKNTIITEREQLKETDDYKKAIEEEWASRQRALQLQAEEAQKMKRLLKRRKAETMRLLDMERRQKQRVEEMRETQKKDEENMNLKEQIRAEVRKELKVLEKKCRDMASVLRGLGLSVGSGPHPSMPEVRAAYKRALLTFHPDRASRSDIRQLVEAEEKFKLISRMKEKLLPNV